MNARWIVPVLVVFIAAFFKVSPAQEQAGKSTLPAEIVHYYSVCNAVNLHSTPAERRVLSREPSVLGLPEKYNSDRLSRIYKLMHWILEQEQEIDPEISFWGAKSFIKDTPTGVAVVDRHNFGGGGIQVRLTIYQDDRELIRRLVTDLDSAPGKKMVPLVPPDQEKVLSLVRTNISRREIHTWIKLGDNWIKRAVNLVLLEG